MKTETLNSTLGTRVEYLGQAVAMYSPQPLRLYYDKNCKIQMVINNSALGIYTEEVRSPKLMDSGLYCTEFEMSRMLQLCSDLDAIMARVKYDGTPSSISEKMILHLYNADTSEEIFDKTLTVLYAACDAGEKITNDHTKVRLYVNYPQTINVGVNGEDNVVVVGGDDTYSIATTGQKKAGYEIDWMALMDSNGDSEANDVRYGKETDDYCSYPVHIDGIENVLRYGNVWNKLYSLVPDNTAFGKGVYLRWLNRKGALSYWLFMKSKKVFASSQSSEYEVYYDGFSSKVENTWQNKSHRDFTVAETYTIGTKHVTADEYEFLAELTCSPLVEMLVGGTRALPEWTRVNVIAGSYSRAYPKSMLSRLQDFELSIALPQKNTITW